MLAGEVNGIDTQHLATLQDENTSIRKGATLLIYLPLLFDLI